MDIKLGSLFDGSGGFPLAGTLNDIEPIWASEIEPFPMRVTAARFPNMEQLGDVTKINGATVEPVDIITFGSPCQDLSVAGRQAGIYGGQRSCLFFEAIRIIGEMRNASSNKYPRFAVWENVPGAFSSNKGQDFKAVLEAFCKVEGTDVPIPEPPKGRWNPAGCIVGDGFSIAWRIYDSQFWGVPQRRKRIYLIADFASERAGEILFESESVSGDSEQSGPTGQDSSSDAAGSIGRSDQVECLNPWDPQEYRQCSAYGAHPSLQAHQGGRYAGVVYAIDAISSNSMKSKNPHSGFHEETIARTLDTRPDPTCNQGGNVVVYCLQGNGIDRADTAGCNGKGWRTDKCYTLNTIDRPAIAFTQGSFMECNTNGKAATLMARDYKQAQAVAIPQEDRKYIVRRLTPLECCRLQGFPDWWTDGIDGSDSALYKMWGNGIALPCALDVIGRIAKEIDGREPMRLVYT